MTVAEMLETVKRHAKLVLVIMAASMAVCGVMLAMYLGSKTGSTVTSGEHTMTSRVITNGFSHGVASFAVESQRKLQKEYADYSVDVLIDTAPNTVTINITGPDGKVAKDLANTMAHESLTKAQELYEGREEPLNGIVVEAVDAEEENTEVSVAAPRMGLPKIIVLMVVAALGSFILAAFIAIIVDSRRGPIRSIDSIVNAFHASGYDDPDMVRMQKLVTSTSVLAELPTAHAGELILANTRFSAGKDDLADIAIVPLDDMRTAQTVAAPLCEALATEGCVTNVEACASIINNMSLVYHLRDADAVILAIKLWEDTVDELKYTLKELTLAQVAIVGIVLVR